MKRTKKEMSPEQARTFEGFSIMNVAKVVEALSCECSPYHDVFTFNRWRAQGLFVKKGEHGIRLPLVKTFLNKDKKTGEEKVIKIPCSSTVFCRCQVA